MPAGRAALRTKIFCSASKLYLLRQPLGVSMMTWRSLSPALAVPVVLSAAFLVKGLSLVGSAREVFGGGGNLLFLLMMLLCEQSVNRGAGLLATLWQSNGEGSDAKVAKASTFRKGDRGWGWMSGV